MNRTINNYRLTSDSTGYLHDTPGRVYTDLRKWLGEGFPKNYREFIEDIATQFRNEYKQDFEGYELIGSTGGRTGSAFFVHDLAIVDLALAPTLSEFGKTADGWKWVKDNILDKKISAKAPTFAKRASVPLLLERLTNGKTVEEAKKYLSDLIGLRKGIPSSNEIIFDKLRERADDIPHSVLLELVQKDLDVTDTKIPTNVFVVILLFELIKRGSIEAKEMLLNLLGNDEYLKYDGWRYHTLDHFYIISNRTDIQEVILGKLLKNKKWVERVEKDAFTRGDAQRAFTSWATIEAKARIVKEGNLDFLKEFREKGLKSNLVIKSLPEVAKDHPEEVLELLMEGGILTKQVLEEVPDPYVREQIVRVALVLSEKQREHHDQADLREGFAKGALWILDHFMEDPDPKPFRSEHYEGDHEFDYDKKVRGGEDVNTITSVRGNIPWVLQNLANYEPTLPEVYEKTKLLLGDENHYVVQQALIPLSLIAANKRMLDPAQREELHQLLFSLLEKHSGCLPLASYLLRVFGKYRELGESEAKLVLDKLGHIDESAALFIYFAIYRKQQNNDFDSSSFEKLLEEKIQSGAEELRSKISWHFWVIVDDGIDQVENLKTYITILSESLYDRHTFSSLDQLVEVVIKEKKYTELAIKWFKNSLSGRLAYTKTMAETDEDYGDWMQHEGIFEVIASWQPDQFLPILEKAIEIIETGRVYFYDIKSCFRASKISSELRDDAAKEKLAALWERVREVYPRADDSWEESL